MSSTLFIGIARLGPVPPYTDFSSRLSLTLSLCASNTSLSFWPLTAPLSTRGTASRIRQELSPPNYTVKHCHRPLMRTYYVSMDVLQPRSDQGTASQMVTSGGPFSTFAPFFKMNTMIHLRKGSIPNREWTPTQ